MRMKKKVLIAGIAIILAASAVVGYIWSQNRKKGTGLCKDGDNIPKGSPDSGIWRKDRQPLLCKAFIW